MYYKTRGIIYKVYSHYDLSELSWSVFSRIWTGYGEVRSYLRSQSECGKTWTRITPNMGTFHAVQIFKKASSWMFKT